MLRGQKKKIFLILALSLGLVLFLFMAEKSGPGLLIRTLQRFTLWHFIAITCTFLVQLLFSVIFIRLVVRKLDHKISLRKLFPLQLIKFSVSYVTPFSNNGGEPLQIYLMKKKHGVPYSKSSAAIFLEALLKLAVSLVLIAIGCVYFCFKTHLPILKILFLLILFFFLFLIGFFFCCLAKNKGYISILGKYFYLNRLKFFQRKQKVIRNIDRCTLYFFQNHTRAFALSLFVSLCIMLCYLARFYLILIFLGFNISLFDLVLVFALTQSLILVPIPTLLGIHEAGQGLLSLITSIPLEGGVAFVIILRITSLLMTIPGFLLLGHQGLNGLGRKIWNRLFFSFNNNKNYFREPRSIKR